MITVKVDLRPLARALRDIGKEAGTVAIRRSLNRAMDGMKVVGKRGILQTANLKPSEVDGSMKKFPATGGSYVARVVVKDRWRSASYPLFRLTQSAAGATFTPWKDKGSQFVRGGFVAAMKSGHRSIFKRNIPIQKRGKNRSWLGIHDVGWGPNAAREMVRADKDVPKKVQQAARERFAWEFQRQYDLAVKAAKAKHGL